MCFTWFHCMVFVVHMVIQYNFRGWHSFSAFFLWFAWSYSVVLVIHMVCQCGFPSLHDFQCRSAHVVHMTFYFDSRGSQGSLEWFVWFTWFFSVVHVKFRSHGSFFSVCGSRGSLVWSLSFTWFISMASVVRMDMWLSCFSSVVLMVHLVH